KDDGLAVARAQEESLDLGVLDDLQAPAPAANDASDAQAPAEANAPAEAENVGFMRLVLAGGWIGAILLVASIIAASLAIRLALAARRKTFLPEDLKTALSSALARGDIGAARKAAEASDSFLGRVAAAGLREADRGWAAVEKAAEDAVADETAACYRRTEPLSTIGNVAPMLGLLGTVLGMVTTFGELAVADAGGRNLANGIYFALVTTVDGLIVAIPALVAHSLLNARFASLISDATAQIDGVFAPLKRAALVAKVAPQSQAPPQKPFPQAPAGLQEVAPPRAERAALSLKSRSGE
ncbi:MAG: MotA/TolQ/ExbB proton channel family protein, partial [Thermoguttaceae bacterium]|nr:MotA/TolQ/ExbB proton channel family protein [Thermoguttaceae bacterium]